MEPAVERIGLGIAGIGQDPFVANLDSVPVGRDETRRSEGSLWPMLAHPYCPDQAPPVTRTEPVVNRAVMAEKRLWALLRLIRHVPFFQVALLVALVMEAATLVRIKAHHLEQIPGRIHGRQSLHWPLLSILPEQGSQVRSKWPTGGSPAKGIGVAAMGTPLQTENHGIGLAVPFAVPEAGAGPGRRSPVAAAGVVTRMPALDIKVVEPGLPRGKLAGPPLGYMVLDCAPSNTNMPAQPDFALVAQASPLRAPVQAERGSGKCAVDMVHVAGAAMELRAVAGVKIALELAATWYPALLATVEQLRDLPGPASDRDIAPELALIAHSVRLQVSPELLFVFADHGMGGLEPPVEARHRYVSPDRRLVDKLSESPRDTPQTT